VRYTETGHSEIAPDVDGKPGAWGTDDVYLGTLAPMRRRSRIRDAVLGFVSRAAAWVVVRAERLAVWAENRR